jgi:hypothetical protein
MRPAHLPPIQGWEVSHHDIVRPPKGTTHVVLDTPAGLHGKRLEAVLRIAQKMLIPLQPSLFDIQATHACLGALRAQPRAAEIELALVGMRVREHTLSNDQLHQYPATLNMQVGLAARHTELCATARGRCQDVAPSRGSRLNNGCPDGMISDETFAKLRICNPWSARRSASRMDAAEAHRPVRRSHRRPPGSTSTGEGGRALWDHHRAAFHASLVPECLPLPSTSATCAWA